MSLTRSKHAPTIFSSAKMKFPRHSSLENFAIHLRLIPQI
jgi:hypothetical protein